MGRILTGRTDDPRPWRAGDRRRNHVCKLPARGRRPGKTGRHRVRAAAGAAVCSLRFPRRSCMASDGGANICGPCPPRRRSTCRCRLATFLVICGLCWRAFQNAMHSCKPIRRGSNSGENGWLGSAPAQRSEFPGGLAAANKIDYAVRHLWHIGIRCLLAPALNSLRWMAATVRTEIEACRQAGVTLHTLPDINPMNNLDELAATISALDLVVSVGNAGVHLAGALGVPTWALLPRYLGWCWPLDGEQMPWYSSVRVLRQCRGRRLAGTAGKGRGRIPQLAGQQTPTTRR